MILQSFHLGGAQNGLGAEPRRYNSRENRECVCVCVCLSAVNPDTTGAISLLFLDSFISVCSSTSHDWGDLEGERWEIGEKMYKK